jgi:YYY domain-containing protein
MAPVLAFWCSALILAALAFPIAARLFRRFPDAGAGLAFPLGLMLCSYGYFLLRTFDVLPYGRGGFMLAVAGFALVSVAVASTDSRFLTTIRRTGPGILASALLFTAAFFAYAAFRSYNANIGGTEQPMDFLFLNAMLASESYPPADPWLAGHTVSYYYFGYLQTAVLTALSGAESSVGYNLGLATVFASSATGIASLCMALARWMIRKRGIGWLVAPAALGVALLLFAGSLIGVFEFTAAHERYNEPLYSAFGVDHLLPCEPGESSDCYAGRTGPRTNSWYPDEFWFWWRGSRVIPGTITEFPAFSFILGDLHPHVMAVPGVILAVAIAVALWRGRAPLGWQSRPRRMALVVLLAFVFGGLAFQNTWDVLTFSALLAVAVLARNLRHTGPVESVRLTASLLVPAGALAIVLYAPWWLDFSSQAGGVYAYVGEGTRPAHAFLQFGPLVLASGLALLWPLSARRGLASVPSTALYTIWLALLPLAVWGALAALRGDWSTAVQERSTAGWITLMVLALLVWAFATTAVLAHLRRSSLAGPAALASFGVLLIFGAELLLVRDVFFGSVPRLNTVFKLTYQAWVVLSIAGAVALVAATARASTSALPLRVALPPVAAVVLLSFAYVLGAVPNRAGGFGNESDIDGLAFLARNDAAEYALTRWISQNTSPGEVIIEASGRLWHGGADGPSLQPAGVDYTDAGRISSRTGRSTPIGWYFHQIQWRGDSPENHAEFRGRQDAVDAIYLAESPEAALEGIRSFGAEYVVMGRLEQSRYPEAHRIDFSTFLPVAFESAGLRVYRVPHSKEVPTS